MSEEVEAPPPGDIITPAKSEDKLEIEKEEQELLKTEAEENEKNEEETEEKKEEAEAKEEEKKDEEKEDEAGEKKKFKMPKVNIKTPPVPGFLRSKSKERAKNKEKSEDDKPADDDKKEEKEEDKKEEETKEKTTEEGADKKEGEEKAEEKKDDEEQKDTKSKVKEALENIHMPKMPKISKPGFLKKKKSDDGEAKEEEMKDMSKKDDDEADGEEKDEKKEEDKKDEEKKEGETEEDGAKKEEEGEKDKGEKDKENEEKKDDRKIPGFFDNFKSTASTMFGKRPDKKKEKPVDKEETKELLEKKEGEEEEGEKKDEATEGEKEKKEEEGEQKEAESKEPKSGLLDSLRTVASHVPALFKKSPKPEEVDVESGEATELLEKKADDVDSNKKEEGELEEVKVDEIKAEPDAASQGSEKKDPEKAEGEKPEKWGQVKKLSRQQSQRFQELDRTKKCAILGILSGIVLLILIIAICAASTPSPWANEARIVDGGKHIETHTSCGPVQGLVEGEDEFSFRGIPYAVPVTDDNRWTHSRPVTNLEDCYQGKFIAHGQNDSKPSRCWRGFPSGSDGTEDCLNLDIFTSHVVYHDLMPVVVFVGGDDLDMEEDEMIRPSAGLAKNKSVVFVDVNYRQGVLGFLATEALSARSYPPASGNYGLGDLISALKWIRLNINHFGGHPHRVTVLGRGSGASLVTALTAAPEAKGLFQQVWVTNGAGAFQNKTLEEAVKENEAEIVKKVDCAGSDELQCLLSTPAKTLTDAPPAVKWLRTTQTELPQKGEKGHSWIVIDKEILPMNPVDYWKKHRMTNEIKMVFGSTAQGAVTADNHMFMDWNDTNSFEAHVEAKLGSFDVSLPTDALDKYNTTADNWLKYATMVTDIRSVCPLQQLASTASVNSVANVYSYVATQGRKGVLGGVADATADVAAILGVFEPTDEVERKFVENIQSMFYSFVTDGTLPHGDKDITLGMYTVGEQIATHRDYPRCDFWENSFGIVPEYAQLD